MNRDWRPLNHDFSPILRDLARFDRTLEAERFRRLYTVLDAKFKLSMAIRAAAVAKQSLDYVKQSIKGGYVGGPPVSPLYAPPCLDCSKETWFDEVAEATCVHAYPHFAFFNPGNFSRRQWHNRNAVLAGEPRCPVLSGYAVSTYTPWWQLGTCKSHG